MKLCNKSNKKNFKELKNIYKYSVLFRQKAVKITASFRNSDLLTVNTRLFKIKLALESKFFAFFSYKKVGATGKCLIQIYDF